MLQEGNRRRQRGTDVVVGWVQAYDRPRTLEAIGELEIVPPRSISHRGVAVEEMDVDAIIARRPQVALVDELAHTNVAGSRNQKRYQDVLELQASGISVISTLNIQQIAGLQDTVRLVAGVAVSDTLPDWVVDAADDLEIVDAPPEVLQKRMRRGNVLPREQVERALEGYFQTDTLVALRELTLRRMVEHRRRRLDVVSGTNGAAAEAPSTSAETVLVCLPSGSHAQTVLTRGVHLAERLQARLVVVHVTEPGGPRAESSRARQEVMKSLQLASVLGAEVQSRIASDVAQALVEAAREVGATQIVLGEGNSSWLRELAGRSTVREVLRRARDVDVHIVRRVEA